MNCEYCGNAFGANAMACAGCGSPRTVALAEPAGTAATIYEQIGRAVVNREPNEALDRLIAVGERRDAPPAEQKAARAAKALFCLFVVWQFPMILAFILPFGMMFFMWIYLPYMGLKRLLSWLSS